LGDVGGVEIRAKLKGNRAECGCYERRDIGAYDTCPMGCVYCYAVKDGEVAKRKLREHDLEAECLR
jgi:DNA repair photolyase